MTTCMNGHSPEAIEVRPNGARVCLACRAEYGYRARKGELTPHRTPDRETNHEHHAR